MFQLDNETTQSISDVINAMDRQKSVKKLKKDTEKINEKVEQNEVDGDKIILAKDIGTDFTFKRKIVWFNVIGFLFLHTFAVYGMYLFFFKATFKMILWTLALLFLASESVTIGAHRLFTHRSFKATPILRAILVVLQTLAGQNCVYIWVRDHRQHHRYADTDADPHNSKRGFFFSHIGWLMSKKHPAVIQMGKTIDMSDLEADWMVMLQKRFYKTFYTIFSVLIPVVVPIVCWNENWVTSLMVGYFFRYMFQVNGTWLVNSAAHLYGTRPYDKTIQPVESEFVSFISLGEGWHNYHHAFPWDYRAAEYGMHYNFTATIIEFFQKIGWASDLKIASDVMVENRIKRKGDGTHHILGDEQSKKQINTAFGLFKHPLNPSYNCTYEPLEINLDQKGLPLLPEDLSSEEKILNDTPFQYEVRKRIFGAH